MSYTKEELKNDLSKMVYDTLDKDKNKKVYRVYYNGVSFGSMKNALSITKFIKDCVKPFITDMYKKIIKKKDDITLLIITKRQLDILIENCKDKELTSKDNYTFWLLCLTLKELKYLHHDKKNGLYYEYD